MRQKTPRNPKSHIKVKTFMRTMQFNAKFLGGRPSEASLPNATEPLCLLAKENAKIIHVYGQQ